MSQSMKQNTPLTSSHALIIRYVTGHMRITDFYNKYDYVQFLLTMMGMKHANCNYACLWCTIAKDARYASILNFSS